MFRSAPYRADPKVQKIEGLKVGKHLKADVVEPTTFGLATPVIFVPKNEESVVFCIDYSYLKSHSQGNQSPTSYRRIH